MTKLENGISGCYCCIKIKSECHFTFRQRQFIPSYIQGVGVNPYGNYHMFCDTCRLTLVNPISGSCID